MNVKFYAKNLIINGIPIKQQWDILDAFEVNEKIIVLFNPDSYLCDPAYREQRRAGHPANKNLIALSVTGKKIWEADFPTDTDYYYQINSRFPFCVASFSSYDCTIDIETGKILSKVFFK